METKKILVADDEIGIVQVISSKLRNNGFEVLTADNGDNAFIICCEQKPDVVVADYELPGISGLELAEKIHKLPAMNETSFILLATKENEISDKQIETAGVTERLNKPFSPKELLSKVESVMDNKAEITG
jgi:two-component system alkaline phosphatase synthesis response regulator PhoP